MSILGWVLAWCGSGLDSVSVDLGAEINKCCPSVRRLSPLGNCLHYHLGPES